jgi:hypothetical protein
MKRSNPAPETPCDPSQVVVGDMVTATRWPRRWRYNKAMLVTGIVSVILDGGFTLLTAGGYHTVRVCDVVKVKRIT